MPNIRNLSHNLQPYNLNSCLRNCIVSCGSFHNIVFLFANICQTYIINKLFPTKFQRICD